MKILIACDSFKESASSIEVAECIKKGLQDKSLINEIKILPVADGGEGTLESISYGIDGTIETAIVSDPLTRNIKADWFYIPKTKTAFIESAQAIGLGLLDKDERNPLRTHTRGLGTLIENALNKGAKNIFVGIGGSSTNDGGTGMLNELGVRFVDSENQSIIDGNTGLKSLVRIHENDLKISLDEVKITVACDVTNPLTGPNGATYIYGAQKGADKDMLDLMESNMQNYRQILISTGRVDPNTLQGSGAAGGLGCAFSLFLNAELKSGFDLISEISNLEDEIVSADLIITGEGRIDSQSLNGKVPIKIAEIASKHHKEVVAVAGKIEDSESKIESYFSQSFDIISRAKNLEDAMENSCYYLNMIGKEIGDFYLNK